MFHSNVVLKYSSPPLTRTPKGNEKLFELATVRGNRCWCYRADTHLQFMPMVHAQLLSKANLLTLVTEKAYTISSMQTKVHWTGMICLTKGTKKTGSITIVVLCV